MVFAQPLFLVALSALAIPILIHLFNFRRYRKVYFTNVRFLAGIRQETRRRSELKHLLILLMRLLAIACLVFAFAKPYVPSFLQTVTIRSKNAVSVYIDNSFSMEALSTQGPLLEEARKKALEITDAYGPSDLFQLLTNDFEGKHQRLISRDEFRSEVGSVSLSPAVRSLPEIVKRQSDLLKTSRDAGLTAYLISDFQKSTAFPEKIVPVASIPVFLVPVEASKISNLYIDSAWFENPVQQPGQATKLIIRVRNSSDEPLEKIPLRLTINNIQKAVTSLSAGPEGTASVAVHFTNNDSGDQYGTLELTDYPVTWDDNLFFTYSIHTAIPVLSIREGTENRYLKALFESDSSFRFGSQDIGKLDYSSFGQYPLLILSGTKELSTGLAGELARHVAGGGNLLLFHGTVIRAESFNALSATLGSPAIAGIDTASLPVSEVNTDHALFRDVFEKDATGRVVLPDNVDMPSSSRHYILKNTSLSVSEDLMKLQNGQPFLTVTPYGKGKVYTCAVPLDEEWSNFPKHPLFVPVLYRIALLSQPSLPLYYDLAAVSGIEVPHDSIRQPEVYRIRKKDSGFEIVPGMKSTGSYTLLFPEEQIREAGHYQVIQGEQIIQGIAFDYNRKESDPRCHSPEELESLMKKSPAKIFTVLAPGSVPLSRQIAELGKGIPLWKYFVIGTLFFLLIEIILARSLKE